ncbi:MAG: hypothetical protein V1777_03340 [Candidatus Micrarchaeota archaeon]
MKEKILQSGLTYSDLLEIREFLENEVSKRFVLYKRGTTSQIRQALSESEKDAEEFLIEKGFVPQGKKSIQTKFNTFIATDNFYLVNGKPTAVFVSQSEWTGLIGSAALVKELAILPFKTVAILQKKPHYFYRSMCGVLSEKYIDKCYHPNS